ncbi:MAG: class B sortase [Pseudobutyrivibrio ruminis]|nr:class B sortase [Pseudobutyrivibrio ruminis]
MNIKAFRIIGTILILAVIIVAAPVAIPRLVGISSYNVISGSMEPTISVGSIVYVKGQDFDKLSVGDIIAFNSGASVVTHRITAIDSESMLITTKGDANSEEDFTPIAYTNVIGKVVFHIPVYGNIAAMVSETGGKVVAAILLILGTIFSMVGEEKQKPQNVNPKIFLVLGLVIVFGALAGFTYIYFGYKQSNDLYASINTNYVQISDSEQWQDLINVDIQKLQEINPEVVGWIYVEGTDISYPIMYSADDEKYLHTTITSEYAKAGSIFLEGYNLPDFSDSHSIIYGHNMRNLSMFGSLKYYKTEDNYFDDHRYFQIITKDKKMRFEIFSYFDTEAASWVYTVPYSDSQDFEDYIAELLAHSYIKQENSGTSVSSADTVVTLSTCSNTGMRFTVHGVLKETVSGN